MIYIYDIYIYIYTHTSKSAGRIFGPLNDFFGSLVLAAPPTLFRNGSGTK